MNSKRTGRFYRKNEEEVMQRLGLTPTKNSGSGWIEKEDGQNDHFICQLKSTDKDSISIRQQDLHTLEYNAIVSHKMPVFAIQFLNTDEVWLMAKSTDFRTVASCLEGSYEPEMHRFDVSVGIPEDIVVQNLCNPVQSDPSAREKFYKQLERSREKK